MISILAAVAITMPQVEMRTVRAILAGSGTVAPHGAIAGGRMRALIEPNGDVEDCRLLVYAGEQRSAERLCRLFERQRIKPAKDAQGTPIHALFDTTIWTHPSADSALPRLPDPEPIFELTVERLPPDIPNPFTLAVAMVIDETGRVTTCGALDDASEALSRAACEQMDHAEFDPVTDRKGNAVRHAMMTTVRFSTSPRPSP